MLGLVLTSRGKSAGNPIPLAGLPYHAVDGYLKKMLQHGYKVAVCEQVEDPKKAKGVVKRDVVRVVTPGTVTERGPLSSTRISSSSRGERPEPFSPCNVPSCQTMANASPPSPFWAGNVT